MRCPYREPEFSGKMHFSSLDIKSLDSLNVFEEAIKLQYARIESSTLSELLLT